MIFLYIIGAVAAGLIIAWAINHGSYLASIPPRRAIGQDQGSFDVEMANFNAKIEKRDARYNAMVARNEKTQAKYANTKTPS